MIYVLSLAFCLDARPPQLLAHELAVAAQQCALLEHEVELGKLAIDTARRDSNAAPSAAAIAAARQANVVAKLQAHRAQLAALQSLAGTSRTAGTSALVFAVPGFGTHPQLVPVSRLVIDMGTEHSPFLLQPAAPLPRKGLRNSQAWAESLKRSMDASDRSRLAREVAVAVANEQLEQLEQVRVWRTQPLSPQIQTVGYSANAPTRLTADSLAAARVSYQRFLNQLKPQRVQFAKWTLSDSSSGGNGFAWPKPVTMPSVETNGYQAAAGKIRVWGSPTDDQLESAIATASLRVDRARRMADRLRRQTESSRIAGISMSKQPQSARQNAAAYQLILRRAEYKLTLAIQDVYLSPSSASVQKLRARTTALYRLHSEAVPLVTVATRQVETLTEEVESRQSRLVSDAGAWKAWTDTRVRLGRAESLLHNLLKQQQLAAKQARFVEQISR